VKDGITTFINGTFLEINDLKKKGQESQKRSKKMTPIGLPETSVRNYHYSLRNDPEERSSHLLRGGSLKSRMVSITVHFDPL